MSGVRAKAGVPVLADFTGADMAGTAAPLVVNSSTGDIYAWKSGDGIVLAGNTGAGGGTVTHTAGNLTANALVVGNAAADVKVLASLGTTTTVLHGNAAGAPTWGAVNLATDVTGSLPAGSVSGLATIATSGAITDATGILLAAHGGTGSANFTLAGLSTARTITFPDSAITVARTDAANTFTGIQTFSTPIATASVATMTATVGGGVPTPPNDTSKFLRGDATWTPVSASLSSITASLAGDVALNNTANYFDGPNVAQGAVGTWFVSGSVNIFDGAIGGATFGFKLWDGTTVIASGEATTGATNGEAQVSLSGVITTPAGNLRISVRDFTSINGNIKFNASGLSKDSTITAVRIA